MGAEPDIAKKSGSSAVTTAERHDLSKWTAHPKFALALRLAATAVPIGAGMLAIRIVTTVVAKPDGLVPLVLWFGAALVLAFVALRSVERVTRRLLPLAALFKMSLVFPDRAPRRFGVALRTGTVHQLEGRMEQLKAAPDSVDVVDAAETLIALVDLIGKHDRLTRGHCERVRAYSDLIAQELGLAMDDREKLHWSALLHDVGKLGVDATILSKPGRPSNSEWAAIRTHPTMGADLLLPLIPWLGDWTRASSDHHERWDGAGYPNGLAGVEISLAGRIVAVADSYDVMTAARSYKKPIGPEKARAELADNAGSQFDPEIVRAFLNVGLGNVDAVVGSAAWISQFPGLAQSASTAATAAGTTLTVSTLAALTAFAGITAGPAHPADASGGGSSGIEAVVASVPDVEIASPVAETTGSGPTGSLPVTAENAPRRPAAGASAVEALPARSTAVDVAADPDVPPSSASMASPDEPAAPVVSTTTSFVPSPVTTAAPAVPVVSTTTSFVPSPVTTAAPVVSTTTSSSVPSPVTTAALVVSTTSTSLVPSPVTTAAPVVSTTTTPAGVVQTATSPGGSITVSFTPGAVSVLSVDPAPGYTYWTNRIKPSHVQIVFENGVSSYKIKARWLSGAPSLTVE